MDQEHQGWNDVYGSSRTGLASTVVTRSSAYPYRLMLFFSCNIDIDSSAL
jgi:hypothetical protein